MVKQNTITWILLMALTVLAGIISNTSMTFAIPLILGLAALKFVGVSFNFMEMKKANLFWKILILGYLLIFCGIILASH